MNKIKFSYWTIEQNQVEWKQEEDEENQDDNDEDEEGNWWLQTK